MALFLNNVSVGELLKKKFVTLIEPAWILNNHGHAYLYPHEIIARSAETKILYSMIELVFHHLRLLNLIAVGTVCESDGKSLSPRRCVV